MGDTDVQAPTTALPATGLPPTATTALEIAFKTISGLQERVIENLAAAIRLKDFAIRNNFDVPDDIIDDLNSVVQRTDKAPANQDAILRAVASSASVIDRALRDLTNVTYPVTVDTLPTGTILDQPLTTAAQSLPLVKPLFVRLFWWIVALATIAGTLGAGAGFTLSGATIPNSSSAETGVIPTASYAPLWYSILAMSLGLLGSLVFLLVGLTRGKPASAMTPTEVQTSYIRLALGIMVGWVFYFAFSQGAFERGNNNAPLLLLPFLAGFSTRFVVGILNKAVQAVELTLGLSETGSRARERRRVVAAPE